MLTNFSQFGGDNVSSTLDANSRLIELVMIRRGSEAPISIEDVPVSVVHHRSYCESLNQGPSAAV